MNDAKTIAQRWFEQVWNERREETIDDLLTPDSQGHVEGGEVRGPAGYRKMYTMFRLALPDVELTIEDILSEGDRAAVRWRARGTHGGDGFGFPPTGRAVEILGTSWMVVRDGKVVEFWDTWNLGTLLASLR